MKKLSKWCYLSLAIAVVPFVGTPAMAEEYRSAQSQTISDGVYSQAQLEQMLAPIALYPDSLLTHILIASTYPLEVVEAQRFYNKNQRTDPAKLMDKAEKYDWDPSVVALLAFPTVLQKLNDDLGWTQNLGDAFLQDEARVLDSIQSLRRQADNASSLNNMDNMTVSRANNQIIIEAARPEIVFVPYYDPRIVYGHWRWSNYPPIYWSVYPGYVRYPSRSSVFYWNSGINIGFNFYFSAFHWHKHQIVVERRPHYDYRHRYPSHTKFVTSSGAQRWHHQAKHRRGVAYSTPVVSRKYHSAKPSYQQVKQSRHEERYGKSPNKGGNNQGKYESPKSHYAKPRNEVNHSREQQFSNKLTNRSDNGKRTQFTSDYAKKDNKQQSHNAQQRTASRPEQVRSQLTDHKPSRDNTVQSKARHDAAKYQQPKYDNGSRNQVERRVEKQQATRTQPKPEANRQNTSRQQPQRQEPSRHAQQSQARSDKASRGNQNDHARVREK